VKIATYNVWYEGIEARAQQLLEEINRINADIIGLQEVPPDFYEKLITNTKFLYHEFVLYDEEMGLAVLSRFPICKHFSLTDCADFDRSIAHNVIVETENIKFSITNVHLPWDSVLAKERQIVAIDKYIHMQKDKADFFILLGDFNCTHNSSVHHYLLGDQSLLESEARPYWNDLAGVHAGLNGYEVVPTLDFVNNPRWQGENTNYLPDVCDRIYIMESFNWKNEFKLKNVEIFGKEVSTVTKLAPSDHYGLAAEAMFKI
jgi:Metal-dependent hydrolase